MTPPDLSRSEFSHFQSLILRIAGIHLSESKQVLLAGRLARRLKHYELASFGDYYRLVTSGGQQEELQVMVDLLTTNETYFFREPKHFEFLADELLPLARSRPFAVWSAACSSGEEAYSLAMVLDDRLGEDRWELTASDISTAVLAKARAGHYSTARSEGIPPAYLRKYCLRGVRAQEGTLLIAAGLRERVRFMHVNLTAPPPAIGPFDVIFLRNVMIYFAVDTKRKVVANLLTRLKPGGHLIIGHSETLTGVTEKLEMVRPTIYRKP